MGPTPSYGARAEKPHFAKKQTNICRLSGDIKTVYKSWLQQWRWLYYVHYVCGLLGYGSSAYINVLICSVRRSSSATRRLQLHAYDACIKMSRNSSTNYTSSDHKYSRLLYMHKPQARSEQHLFLREGDIHTKYCLNFLRPIGQVYQKFIPRNLVAWVLILGYAYQCSRIVYLPNHIAQFQDNMQI